MRFYIFIHHNNDLDSLAPIIYKLATTNQAFKINIVNTRDLISGNDPRIDYLKIQKNVEYTSIIPTNSNSKSTSLSFLSKYTFPPRLKHYFQRRWSAEQSAYLEELHKNYSFDNLVPDNGEPAFFIFDYNPFTIVSTACKFATKRNIPVAFIPHGARVMHHASLKLFAKSSPPSKRDFDTTELPDVLFANNTNYVSSEAPANHDRFKILGLPRYTAEWSNILTSITSQQDLPQPGPDKLRIVFMPSKWKSFTWEEGTMQALKNLLDREDVFLIIKDHPRGRTFRNLLAHPRLFIAGSDIHSLQIIEWADLTLFLTSSIFLDALLLDKPTLHLRYCTAHRLACEHLMTDWNVDSLLDLEEWIDRLSADHKARTYNQEERKACLDYYVNDPDGDLLERYVEAILSMRKRTRS